MIEREYSKGYRLQVKSKKKARRIGTADGGGGGGLRGVKYL